MAFWILTNNFHLMSDLRGFWSMFHVSRYCLIKYVYVEFLSSHALTYISVPIFTIRLYLTQQCHLWSKAINALVWIWIFHKNATLPLEHLLHRLLTSVYVPSVWNATLSHFKAFHANAPPMIFFEVEQKCVGVDPADPARPRNYHVLPRRCRICHELATYYPKSLKWLYVAHTRRLYAKVWPRH